MILILPLVLLQLVHLDIHLQDHHQVLILILIQILTQILILKAPAPAPALTPAPTPVILINPTMLSLFIFLLVEDLMLSLSSHIPLVP